MLKDVSKALGRFLKAEEVPRWFGLSLVLIYLVGLGTVTNVGIRQVRSEAAGFRQQSGQYAVKMLADSLAHIDITGMDSSAIATSYQRLLREFAESVLVRTLRVVQGRRVMASIVSMDVGTQLPIESLGSTPQNGSELRLVPVAGQEDPDLLIRYELMTVRPKVTSAAEVGPLILEAQLPAHPYQAKGIARYAGALSIVLVVLGALFVVYRCLREQLRGVSRIADRLQTHRDRLEDDLSSLRISDTLDAVTGAWNELVDLTQRLSDTVQRAEANDELSRVLQSSGGSALAEALNAIPDGFLYIKEEGRFEYFNSAACRLFGWSVEQVRQTSLVEAQAQGTGAKVLDLVRSAMSPDGTFTARTEVVEAKEDASQSCSSYRVWVIPLSHSQRDRECVVMVRDVSQQLRAERAREEFVSQVTHELRTPLTNIRAYAETLSSGMFDDPKVITECYNVITKETRRLSRLIEDILSVSQLAVGTIELAVATVDLKTLLGEAVRDVRKLADDKNLDLQLILPAKLEPISGDRDKLAVVVNNLLGNAIKYTPSEGNVIVGCQLTNDAVVLTFKDNGIGIDKADHARVFEKFQRGNDPAVQNETGTGIGLYTAREIVRRHGGDISLISQKGQGSTFLVRIPRSVSRADSLGSTQSPVPTSTGAGSE